MKSSSAKLVGVWAAWHQRSSWARPPGTGTAIFKLSCYIPGQSCKTMISAGKHRGFSLFAVFFLPFTCLSRFFHSLSLSLSLSLSRGASLSVSLCFLLTGTWPKSCLGATSVLNEFFQNFVDHRMPLHYNGL